MDDFKHKCTVCGKEINSLNSQPPIYCALHDPEWHWATQSTLDKLSGVPRGFRLLVEREELPGMVSCGDFEDLTAAEMLIPFEFEALTDHPNLQPFGNALSGALWCWRTDLPEESDSGVCHVEIWGELTEYSPSFDTFLYRGALEVASGRWHVESDDLVERFHNLAGTLTVLGREDLAQDLREISILPYRDLRSDEYRRLGLKCEGVISKIEARERISRYLGDKYLCDEVENV